VFQSLSLPPSSGVDVMFDAAAHYFCSRRICFWLSHPQRCERMWTKSGGHWDRTPVMTAHHPLFTQQPVLWQLRADSVGVNTMCSCITLHVNLWCWRQRWSLKHLIPTPSSQTDPEKASFHYILKLSDLVQHLAKTFFELEHLMGYIVLV
jgi:hypothetical protein